MPLGWETNTKYTVESESLRGKPELEMGNPRVPHPLTDVQHGCSYKSMQAPWILNLRL